MTCKFDTTGKGKSAVIAAAPRRLEAEVYGYTEQQVIGFFHDMAKFFDAIGSKLQTERQRRKKVADEKAIHKVMPTEICRQKDDEDHSGVGRIP